MSATVPFSYDPPELSIVNPSPANAQGGVLRFLGKNFGANVLDETAAVNITIDGVPCPSPQFIRPSLGSAYLTCMSDPMPVGRKNLTLNVAAQEQRIYADPAANAAAGNLLAFTAYCEKNYHGRDGEHCVPCPRGAVCEACVVPAFNVTAADGGVDMTCAVPDHNDGYAEPGWWLGLVAGTEPVSGSPDPRCQEQHTDRQYCPMFVPCEPFEACIGNNTCSSAYVGDRCRDCADQHYRLSGECVPCPGVCVCVCHCQCLCRCLSDLVIPIVSSSMRAQTTRT